MDARERAYGGIYGQGLGPAFARTNGAIPRLMAKGGADFTLCKRKRLCYSRTLARVVPGSSAVEQPAVNRLVAGSNPARGATFDLLL
jgi:hypothetical protein